MSKQVVEEEGYPLQLHMAGKSQTWMVFFPDAAFSKLEPLLTEIRPHLVAAVHDRSVAEDLVQGALLNAYRYLNNGQLHAIKTSQETYLLVRGGTMPSFHQCKDEQTVMRWLHHGKEDPPLDVIEEPRAWLRTIVRKIAYNYYQGRKNLLKFYEDYGILQVEQHFEGPERTILNDERDAELRALVAALPQKFRETILLRYWEECSFSVIAERSQQLESTVKSWEFRARKKLRKALIEQRNIEDSQLAHPQKYA